MPIAKSGSRKNAPAAPLTAYGVAAVRQKADPCNRELSPPIPRCAADFADLVRTQWAGLTDWEGGGADRFAGNVLSDARWRNRRQGASPDEAAAQAIESVAKKKPTEYAEWCELTGAGATV